MTQPILYDAFGEDGDLEYINGTAVLNNSDDYYISTNQSQSFRPGYARCAIVVQSHYYMRRFWTCGPLTTFWHNARMWTYVNSNDTGYTLLSFMDDNGKIRLGIQAVSLNNSNYFAASGIVFQLFTVDDTNTKVILQEQDVIFPSNNPPGPDNITINMNYASEGGFFSAWVNGIQWFNYVGDITTNGYTQLYGSAYGTISTDYGSRTAWSEMLLSDSPTFDFSMETIVATNYGSTTQWTGNISNINNVVVDDANFDSTTTSGDIQLYQMGNVINNNSVIVGIVTNLRCTQGVGNLSKIALVQIIGGTQYITTAQDLPIAFKVISFVQSNSPASGEPWTISELNTGFESGYQATTS